MSDTQSAFKQPGNRINLLGMILGVVLVLLPRNAIAVVGGLIIIFICSLLLLWNTKFVESYRTRGYALAVILALACAGLGYLTWPRPDPAPPQSYNELTGLLIPANEPPIQEACGKPIAPHNVLTVILGPLTVVTSKADTSIRVQGEKVFGVTKDSGGGVKIFARVISSGNKVVAAVADNVLYVNPDNRFQLQRPDWHSLIVVDTQAKDKRKVLDVYFLNPRSIRVYGDFYVSNETAFSVNEGRSFIGANLVEGYDSICLWVTVLPRSDVHFAGTEFVAE